MAQMADNVATGEDASIQNESEEKTATEESKETSSGATGQMSKRQLRKLEKLRQWKETEPQRKEKRKIKKKEFKEKRKQRLESLRSQAEEQGIEPSSINDPNNRKRLKSNSMEKSLCKVGLCIDMSFSDLMIDKDLHKCIKQVHRCYSINRRYENPVQFYVTSFKGKPADVMNKHAGWENWDLRFCQESYLELEKYPKEKIVYLTAESDNVLREPLDDHLYVIGGLVDHNSQKGLCHKLANEKGLRHARLPLDEFVEMSTRKVLSINHVFEIIGGITQNRTWEDVLMEILPPRNQPRLKRRLSESENETTAGGNNTDTEMAVDNSNEVTGRVKSEMGSTSSTP